MDAHRSPDSSFTIGRATWYEADCLEWLAACAPNTIHAVCTDPPYGLREYEPTQLEKRENGSGGLWRIPPSFDGHRRSPLPRFTVLLGERDLAAHDAFFHRWATVLLPAMVPGAHLLIATNPLLAPVLANAVRRAGFEPRGQIVRLVQTMRGGDRPKGAHEEFAEVTVMPRSQHEPWLLFRKPCEGRVQDNLRKWKTGGLRRVSQARPFGDVIHCRPTGKEERSIAPHPSLKPQEFLRKVVRAMLPLGDGLLCDPFAGSGSTLAAAEFNGYASVGVERDARNTEMARQAIPALARFKVDDNVDGKLEAALADYAAAAERVAALRRRAGLVVSPNGSRTATEALRTQADYGTVAR